MTTFQHFIPAFRQIAARRGDAPALIEAGRAISYFELERRSRAIAAYLMHAGVRRERVVGLCAEKTGEYIAAMLGTWMAGAALLPLDPTLPRDRLLHMVNEAGAEVILAPSARAQSFGGLSVRVIHLEGALTAAAADPGEIPAGEPGDLAYVIFTSGSTGRPKGVMVTHRGIVNLLDAQIAAFGLNERSRTLFYLSPSFDASISDIGTTLLSGSAMCIETADALRPGAALAETIRDRKITHIDIPPALLRTMDPANMPTSLETIIIGGEPCPPAVVRKWAAAFGVVNVYGPTEATVCTSLCICDPATWNEPLLGIPIPNVRYAILDANLKPQPAGEAGELCIAGPCLARGYANQPELTASRFITHDGERFYRTGDRVVQRADGQYLFLGRVDRQIKLRGLLIAPEEIEASLATHPAIARAAVVKRPLPANPPREGLVAFVQITRATAAPRRKELADHLGSRLPRWMCPQRFELLESMPMTASGKVDLPALEAMELAAGAASGSTAPGNSNAQVLVDIWRRVLGVAAVGMDESFFELGGDSVALLDVVMAAHACGLTIPPPLISQGLTIAQIVEWIEGRHDGGERDKAAGGMSCADLRNDIASILPWRDASRGTVAHRDQAGDDATARSPRMIFLTGATGFLGSQLLVELLRSTTADICCLVRASRPDEGLQRIHRAIAAHGNAGSFRPRSQDGQAEAESSQRDSCPREHQRIRSAGTSPALADSGRQECLPHQIAHSAPVVRAQEFSHARGNGDDFGEEDLHRITAVCGDIEMPRLGLNDADWEYLARDADTIYHCAARVNMVDSYQTLRAANVAANGEILRLMSHGRPKRLHYASTLSVFVATDRNTGVCLESDTLSQTQTVFGGYAQSKWAGEVLLRNADDGAGSISYYRLGLITADSQNGFAPAGEQFGLFVRSLAAAGCVPNDAPDDLAIDITPVDFAAKALARLSLRPNALPATFHIANPTSLTLGGLIAAMGEFGIPIERVSRAEWEDRIANTGSGKNDGWAAYLGLCRASCGRGGADESFAMYRTMDLFQATGVKFDMQNTLGALAGSGIVCRPADKKLLHLYLRNILRMEALRPRIDTNEHE
ncbi:MAG TPA: non-ribosomal peptide synthetase [Tepidisphaeraceae bacterium]|nr:non-ribosomal peptide synthetase [Tepidisphaeraceae bacterium]